MDIVTAPPEQTAMQLFTGYWVSQIASTAVRLKILDTLPGKPHELAARLELHPPSLERLLRACAAVGLVRPVEGGYDLTPVGRLLTLSNPHSLGPLGMMVTDPSHWLSWARLPECVKTGRTSVQAALGVEGVFHYFEAHPEEGERFNQAMAAMSHMWADQLPRAFDFAPYREIVDLGGCHGILLAAALKASPQARGILFDQPHVVAHADPTLQALGVHERVEKSGGDFFREVPSGDLYILKHILHDWDDDQCVTILKNVRRAMRDTARVLVLEMVLAAEPSVADLMDINMLVMTGGRERTVAEYHDLFRRAGLQPGRVLEPPGNYKILEATPLDVLT
ncbi:MAG: methyltransferase [Candidatus Eremiobacterota bacterium]